MLRELKNYLKAISVKTISFYCITLIMICQCFFAVSPVSAYTYTSKYTKFIDNLYIEDFTADYYLSKASDGTSRLKVVETLNVEFDEPYTSHGLTRVIPFTNQDGKNLTMASDSSLDLRLWRNGKEEKPYKIEPGNGFFTVYIGSENAYVSGKQEYKLEYEFRNVITGFTEDGRSWQELYWDTNGNDWKQKFGSVTARVHFEDPDIAKAYQDQSWCYVGSYGKKGEDRCNIKTINDGIEFSAKDLTRGENLTYVLEFQADTFQVPGKTKSYLYVIIAGVAGGVVLFLIICTLRARKKVANKRKFYEGYFVKPEYAPPHDYTVGEMYENYIGKGKKGSNKVATLMELAVQHKVELVKLEKDSKLGRKKTQWQINVKSVDLSPEEEIVLKILNGSKKNLSIGQEIIIKKHTATNELIELGSSYSTKTQENLFKAGLLESTQNPKTKKLKAGKNPCDFVITISILLGIAGFFIMMIFIPDEEKSYLDIVGGAGLYIVTLLCYIVSIIAIICWCAQISKIASHTEKGLEYSRIIEGLKLYIEMAEKERIEFLQSVDGADVSHQGIVKVYEKLLPYAVMFKLEESWIKEMAKYYEYSDVSTPAWYIGVGAFSANDFSSALSSASSYIASTAAHSTTSNSSSGSSGGGGGGFSGGGGGGGGGGSW